MEKLGVDEWYLDISIDKLNELLKKLGTNERGIDKQDLNYLKEKIWEVINSLRKN